MPKTALLAAILIVFSTCAIAGPAGGESPSRAVPYVPIYKGAAVIGEINISDDDILGIVKQAIVSFSSAVGAPVGSNELEDRVAALNLQELSGAIAAIKHIRIVRTRLPQPRKQNLGSIVSFYDSALSKGPWTRILLNLDKPREAQAVYALPNNEGFFILYANMAGVSNELALVRTEGFLDIPKAAAWLRKTLPGLSELAKSRFSIPTPGKPQEADKDQPAPAPR
ncbi:MAG: hypothetical protein Q7T82_19340 [Armatimonadota bacterium]|nr:hypothetical protein [Armatimonadota bacterium]